MSILIESLAVVLRVEAIEQRIPGGVPAFAQSLPPGTVCADGDLARVGFLRGEDLRRFVQALEDAGFVHQRAGRAADFVLADAEGGLVGPCDWAVFAQVRSLVAPLGPIAICKRPGTPDEPVITPEGWDYESSLSKPATWS